MLKTEHKNTQYVWSKTRDKRDRKPVVLPFVHVKIEMSNMTLFFLPIN